MAFDYVKFLAENKLTSTSKLNEKAKNLLNENYVDLRPINSLRESDPGIEAVEDKIKSGKIDLKAVEAAAKKAEQGDTTELAQLMVSAMGMKFQNEEEDLEDLVGDKPEDKGMYDFMSAGEGAEELAAKDKEPSPEDVTSAMTSVTTGDEEDEEDALKLPVASTSIYGIVPDRAGGYIVYNKNTKKQVTKISAEDAKQAKEVGIEAVLKKKLRSY